MFSSNKVDHKIILILDVQSSIVRASLVVVGDQIPKVIFTYSININISENAKHEELIRETINSIKDTIQSSLRFIHHHGNLNQYPHLHKKISNVHYILSSPWIVSDAKIISKVFDKDTEITQKYVSDLVDLDQKELLQSDEPLQVIEQKIFDIKLNSYSVSDWENKPTKTLDVSFTNSVASAKIINYLIDQFKGIVHSNKIYFHSSLLLQYIGIEKVLEPGQNYCLVHIHGDETDASVIKNKACIFFGSYSFGIKDFIEKLSKETGNCRQASDSLVSLYVGNKLVNEENNKNILAIEKVAKDWYSQLIKMLNEHKLNLKPPMSIIITASAHDDCFVKVVKDANPGIPVYVLSVDDLLAKVSFDHFAEKSRLIALYTIAIHSLID